MCEDGKLEYYLEDGRYFVSRESIDLFMHPPIRPNGAGESRFERYAAPACTAGRPTM